MSLIKAIERAYKIKEERNWDTIYWAIDLHGVCLKSNYTSHEFDWVNDNVIETLRLIQSLPESKIIIWTSCYDDDYQTISEFFGDIGISCYINCNPEVENTDTGCFDDKFYFSVLLDDKAGFNPDVDWREIYEYLNNKQ